MSTKQHEDSGSLSEGKPPLGNLDLRSIMDAAEAIAGERGMAQLAHTMMSIVMANAGAERIYLLTVQAEEWGVEASAVTGANGIRVGQRRSLADESAIVADVVDQVIRTRSTVLLEDAVSIGNFVQNPVIQRRQVRSLLALPLIHQGNLLAILYLENNLAPAVFTPDRVQWLELLSGQMAIAVKQNLLNDHLEAEIAARTQALSIAEEQIHSLFENSQIGIGVTTLEGKILAANNALLQMTRFADTEALPQNVADFYVNPEQRADLLERLSTSDSVNDYGVKLRRGDGTHFFAKMNVRGVNRNGQQAIMAMIEDVTEQVALTDELHREIAERVVAEEEYQAQIMLVDSLLDVALDTVEIFDPNDMGYLKWNRTFNELTGYSDEEIRRLNPADDFFDAADLPKVAAAVEKAMTTGTVSVVADLLTKDGSRVPMEYMASVTRDPAGNPKHLIAIGRDITERLQAEAQLRFQAKLLEAVEQAVIVTDVDGYVVYWNPFAEQLYGWSAVEALGRRTNELMVDDYEQLPIPEINARTFGGKSWSGEYLPRRRDGTFFPAGLTVTPITDDAGEPTHMIGVSADITDRKEAENQLAQSVANAERMRLARDLHDSVTQSLFTSTLFAQAGRKQILSGNVEGAEHYLDRILEISHQASKEMRLFIYELLPDSLSEFGLVEAIQRRTDMIEKRVGIDVHLAADDMSNIPASINEALYRITQEALNNALKHAQADHVIIQICREAGQISLLIEDNGVGFDLDEARAGVGIGLRSMAERATQLNSELQIESAPKQGTKISINVENAS